MLAPRSTTAGTVLVAAAAVALAAPAHAAGIAHDPRCRHAVRAHGQRCRGLERPARCLHLGHRRVECPDRPHAQSNAVQRHEGTPLRHSDRDTGLPGVHHDPRWPRSRRRVHNPRDMVGDRLHPARRHQRRGRSVRRQSSLRSGPPVAGLHPRHLHRVRVLRPPAAGRPVTLRAYLDAPACPAPTGRHALWWATGARASPMTRCTRRSSKRADAAGIALRAPCNPRVTSGVAAYARHSETGQAPRRAPDLRKEAIRAGAFSPGSRAAPGCGTGGAACSSSWTRSGGSAPA